MGGNRQLVGDVTRSYCERYPTVPSLQLARILHREERALFHSVEGARRHVRYCRGATGALKRGQVERNGGLIARFDIPPPEPSTWRIVPLPEGIKRWLILADLHVPYHDANAIGVVMDWATRKENRCDGLLLNGDILDAYQLSSWLRDPRKRDFCGEMETAGKLLDAFRKHLKPKKIVWKAANHEYRFDRYMMQHAPELVGIAEFTIPTFMHLKERGVEWVERGLPMDYHALGILHGDEWRIGMTSPVNPARTAYLKAHECVIVAHQHKTSEHTEQTMHGVTITTWSLGCLSDLHPEYAPLNSWNLGFAVLDTRQNWRVENFRISGGEVL